MNDASLPTVWITFVLAAEMENGFAGSTFAAPSTIQLSEDQAVM
ncbi:hypothetical protein [Pseudoclavibacter helvolus]